MYTGHLRVPSDRQEGVCMGHACPVGSGKATAGTDASPVNDTDALVPPADHSPADDAPGARRVCLVWYGQ